jgi:hypothetical protein
MRELRYTLVSDGSSDRALLPILTWLLVEHRVLCPIQAEWADLRWLPFPPKDLAPRIKQSLDLYPCDLLFVHRDAESRPYAQRKAEIDKALASISLAHTPSVCVDILRSPPIPHRFGTHPQQPRSRRQGMKKDVAHSGCAPA